MTKQSALEMPSIDGLTMEDKAVFMRLDLNVPFDGETITIPEMVRLATFYDPDGNKLMLYQDIQKK